MALEPENVARTVQDRLLVFSSSLSLALSLALSLEEVPEDLIGLFDPFLVGVSFLKAERREESLLPVASPSLNPPLRGLRRLPLGE